MSSSPALRQWLDRRGFAQLNARLLAHGEKLLFQWFPMGRILQGQFCIADVTGGDGKSLKINMQTGEWYDFASGDRGHDLIALYAAHHKLKMGDAFHQLDGGGTSRNPLSQPIRQSTIRNPSRRQIQSEGLAAQWAELWQSCKPIGGDALAYLRARSCVIPPQQGDLRWHPTLRHPSGHIGSALVALVTDAITGAPMTLHRTWIRPDGRKADVEHPRLLLPGHRKQRGVIRLWPDEAVTLGLALAEGVETALAVAHGFTPIWAAIDAGNLGAFPVLPGIDSLTVVADNDEAGLPAAAECAQRWANAGREARIAVPPGAGQDAADLVAA